MLYGLARRHFAGGFRIETGWWRAATIGEATARFRPLAQNGDLLKFKHSPVELDHRARSLGLFYGRNQYKHCIPEHKLIARGELANWVMSACDVIGDQTHVEDLITEACLIGHKFRRAEGVQVAFEHFEMYIRTHYAWYATTVVTRAKYRTQKNIQRDCRTYVGQPGRNMRKAA